ncbi:hypothetical protein CH54_1418 [Yersinia rochesterensis]|uniref:Phage protein n=2 Tax=Yersinia rochesterensis TaxID=1604335 RepID=A0ABM5SMD6_9GAMM|nr:hypothetical protein [Yersinia rochesterensis]AIN19622.1 hypothetical protein DJ57_2265 [Yersinia rochesterensis]AJI85771.1 hypothetical protein AW19_246 [Yersinia frederiksenii Y225]AJJ35675.1 hypothetical protein CH54_1418 [Yersinia rochesterensis]
MNNLEELTGKARIERLKSKFELAKSYGSDQLTVPMPDLEALIAQLEAAQKELDEAIVLNKHLDLSIRKGEVVNSSLRERAEKAEAQAESNALEIRKLGLQWNRAEKAEAALSAAQKELFDFHNQEFQQRLANAEHQLYMKDLAIHNIKASRKAQFRKRLAAEAALSAAREKLSKPVVLPEVVVVNISGKYPIEVMYASKVKTFLKAAGFTVEGE